MRNKGILLFLFMLILPLAFAELQLPPNLIKLSEQNKVFAEQAYANIGFGIAFLAGIITFLSPCVLPIFLVFLASGAHQHPRQFLFFIVGMSTALLLMGLVVGYLGKLSLEFFPFREYLGTIAGLFFLFLGIAIFTNTSFGSFSATKKASGAYATGFFLGLGWTTCTGPILAGILAMGALLHNVLLAGLLLFVYSLGIGFPFLLLAFFYPKISPEVKTKITNTGRFAKFLGGAAYIAMGVLLIVFGNTSFFNSFQFGLSSYYYQINDILLESGWLVSLFGLALLALFLLIAYTVRGASE